MNLVNPASEQLEASRGTGPRATKKTVLEPSRGTGPRATDARTLFLRVSCERQTSRPTNMRTLFFLCKPNHTIHVKTNVKKPHSKRRARLNRAFS